MAQINLQSFTNAVRRANDDATFRVDQDTGQLKIRGGGNRISRAIRWMHSKVFRSSSSSRQEAPLLVRQTESSSAHNAFLRAIANDFYSKKDLDDVERILTSSHFQADMDQFRKKGLSARLVKEVIGWLNEKPCSVRREIVKVAHYVSDRKDAEGKQVGNYLSRGIGEMIDERPRLKEAGYRMGEECKRALSERVFNEVVKEVEGRTEDEIAKMKLPRIMRRGQAIADRLINEALDEEQNRLFASAPQASVTEDTGIQSSPQEARTEGEAFLQNLDKLDIPAKEDLKAQLQNANLDKENVKELVNQHTIRWMGTQRLERWYQEALPSEEGGKTSIPLALEVKVQQELAAHGDFLPYAQAKVQARAIIGDYIETHDAGSLPAQLAKAQFPDEVKQQLEELIERGDITDKESLAEHGNRSLADWVATNRVGKWYREELEAEGIKVKDAEIIPRGLTENISSAIRDRSQLWSYPLLKDHAHQIVKDHLEEEIYGTRV